MTDANGVPPATERHRPRRLVRDPNRIRRHTARHVLTALAMVGIYAGVPIPGGNAPPALALIVFIAGLAALCWVVVQLVRRERSAGADDGIRLEAVVALFYAVVVFFSLVYVSLSNRPDQFAELDNRVDALYFTMATIATVGYGDVHPVGELARAVVTAQIFFDLIFLGVAIRIVGPSVLRRRAANRSPDAPEG